MKSKQKGMMTLFTSVMLLLLITLNVFIGAKSSVMDQKIANNQYRSEEALQNAEAGVNQLIDNLQAYVAANPNATDLTTVNSTATVNRFSATYNTATSIITSTGYGSGDAVKTVSQRVVFTAGGGGGPAALNALGNITLGGNSSADSVKAGGSVNTTGSGSIATPGGANTKEFKVALLDHNGNALLDANGVAVLRSMTSEEYFMHFFGGFCPTAKAANNANACEAEVKATIIADTAKGYYCASNCGSLNDSTLTSAYNTGKRYFWLEGGMNHKFTLGTVADPVIVFVMNVVNGGSDVHINANSRLNGILYVGVQNVKTTTSCSCATDAVIISSTQTPVYVNDLTKPIYTLSNTGTKCTTNGGCTDSQGTTIPKQSYYTTTYQQKIGSYTNAPVYGNFTNTTLNANQPVMCTVSACTAGLSSATFSGCTGGTTVGSTNHCSFSAVAVSGTNDAPVQLTQTGTWDNSGGGNAVITGAAITSGSFAGQGTISFVKGNSAVTNALSGVTGGDGFNTTSASVSISSNGWMD